MSMMLFSQNVIALGAVVTDKPLSAIKMPVLIDAGNAWLNVLKVS